MLSRLYIDRSEGGLSVRYDCDLRFNFIKFSMSPFEQQSAEGPVLTMEIMTQNAKESVTEHQINPLLNS